MSPETTDAKDVLQTWPSPKVTSGTYYSEKYLTVACNVVCKFW